jgi:hypothetical protein
MFNPMDATAADGEPLAYPVPFRFDRSDAPRFRLTNRSLETLSGVRFALLGRGSMPVQAPIVLSPGQTATIPIFGDDLARTTILIVRWARQNGDEYLWRVSF